MKKVFVSLLLVFFLSFSASSSAADMKETISYAASVTGVSAELLKALSTSEAKLLGNLGDTLSVISIGQQFYEADDKGAILSILSLAAGKLIDKFCPSTTPFIAGYQFYVASLKVIHDAFWIPTLSDEIYKAYEKQRKQRVIPNEVYIHYLLEPIRADLKAKLISEKYDKESITDWSGQIIPKWKEKIDKEANQILTALLEERYQKKILPELMAEAKKVAEQREKELIEELKDRLYVEVSGTVVKKIEEGTEVVRAAKICVKGKRHCTYSMGNGYYEMKVPYRLLNGGSFQLVCSKAEKTVTSPTIDFLGKLRRRFNVNLGKLEEEEEVVEIEEEEEQAGIVHLVGTISVDPEPRETEQIGYMRGKKVNIVERRRMEGGGTIEMFIDTTKEPFGDFKNKYHITGKTTGSVTGCVLCTKKSEYSVRKEKEDGEIDWYCSDYWIRTKLTRYELGEWIDVWRTDLNYKLTGIYINPTPEWGKAHGTPEYPKGLITELTTWRWNDLYNCWVMDRTDAGVGQGGFVSGTAAEGIFFGYPWSAGVVAGELFKETICQASFTYFIRAFSEVRFNASQSAGNITKYQWDFGDGGIGEGVNLTHIFKDPGVYQVALTVSDAKGHKERHLNTVDRDSGGA